jgi:hypothetical protein
VKFAWSIHSPSEDSIKRLTASRDFYDALSLVTELMGSLETSSSRLHEWSVSNSTAFSRCETYLALCNCILDLIDLDLTEALDFEQIATSG